MKIITSRSNQYVKFIRSLKAKKVRDSSGKFYIEGIRLIGEALSTKYALESLLVCPDLLTSDFAIASIEKGKAQGIEVIEVSKEVFQSFSLKEGPQGIAAVGVQGLRDIDSIQEMKGIWILLENVQDPGNLGSILRSLDGVNGKGLITMGNTTDPFHPTAVRSSTGALFSKLIIQIGFEDFKRWRSRSGITAIGTVCGNAENYKDYPYKQDVLLVMGSEQKGLSTEMAELCDGLVTIQMAGTVDSLNLACAASIVLFEIYNKVIAHD